MDQTPKICMQSTKQSNGGNLDKLNVPFIHRNKTLVHKDYQEKTVETETHIECKPREFK